PSFRPLRACRAPIPRAFVRQTIDLGGKSEKVDADISTFAGTQTENRLVLTVGKFALAEQLLNARRKKLIVGYKSWILPAMNGCSPNQQPRKGTAYEALLRPRRLLHGPAHRGSRSRTHLRSRAG